MNFADMIISALCALLAGTGVGAGGLFIIYLTSFTSMGQHEAQAINLAFFLAAVAAALPLQVRHCKISFRAVFICALFGCAGTLLGWQIRLCLPAENLRILFGIMLTFTGVKTLFAGRGKSGGKSVKK